MSSIFKDRTIEKRVMSVVRAALEKSQKEFDDEVEQAKLALEKAHDDLENAHKANLVAIADKHVGNVLSKLRG